MKTDKTNFYCYNSNLKDRAKDLRNGMTKAEACLWKYALRARMRKGFAFKRQRPVLYFIADFMCKELNLIIEVDGRLEYRVASIKRLYQPTKSKICERGK